MNHSAQSKTLRKSSKTATVLFAALLSAVATTVQAGPQNTIATPVPEPTGYDVCIYILGKNGSIQQWCRTCMHVPILGPVCSKVWAAKD